jgi:putative DNA primase/helicase
MEEKAKGGQLAAVYAHFEGRLTSFADEMGLIYATFDGKPFGLGGEELRDAINLAYFDEMKQVLADSTWRGLESLLAGRARGGVRRRVHLRVAATARTIWVDHHTSLVRITSSGWESLPPDHPEAPYFLRVSGALPLPPPRQTHKTLLDTMRPILSNIQAEGDLILLAAWLLGTLQPPAPYPIMVITGEAGSGKSTIQHALRNLVDPNLTEAAAEPSSTKDILVAALHGHLVAYDNVSYISPQTSDALCRLSTGQGIIERKLYTNADISSFRVQRPLIFNGIDDLVTRADLASRTLQVGFRRLEKRGTLDEIMGTVQQHRPDILGALYNCVADGLQSHLVAQVPCGHRLSDWTRWIAACEGRTGWRTSEFVKALNAASRNADAVAVEASVVAAPLVALAEEGVWTGTATELLATLSNRASPEIVSSKSWPQTPIGLGSLIVRVAPSLRAQGVDVTKVQRTAGARKWQVSKVASFRDREGEDE